MSRIVQVTFAEKSEVENPYAAITHIGGRDWRLTLFEAIELIECGTWAFYVRQGEKNLWLEVGLAGSTKYLRTPRDIGPPQTLLQMCVVR